MPRVNANPITEKEALDYILEKENRPTREKSREIALTWDSEAKTRAFFSARVAKADILEGMRKHITDVVQGRGTTSDARFWIRKFLRTDGASSLAELGFLPEQEARESESIIELASTRRLNLIIEQNVRMAHAVGEYAEFMDDRDVFPYVEYRTREDAKVRNSHTLLNGMIFKVDDPIISRICPPQDFRCRCRLRQMSADELGGRKVSGELPEGWKPPESGFSFDVTKGLAQALPEKEQWGDDIKEEFRKEVQNPPSAVPAAPTLAKPPIDISVPVTGNPQLDAAIETARASCVNKPYEEFHVLDKEGNHVFSPYMSGQNGGEIPQAWKAELKDKILLHNHPNGMYAGMQGYGTSFSKSDLLAAAKTGVEQIIVVTPKRDYLMKTENGKWPNPNEIIRVYDEEEFKIDKKINSRINSGKTTDSIADIIYHDLICKNVAKRLGLAYIVIRRRENAG